MLKINNVCECHFFFSSGNLLIFIQNKIKYLKIRLDKDDAGIRFVLNNCTSKVLFLLPKSYQMQHFDLNNPNCAFDHSKNGS